MQWIMLQCNKRKGMSMDSHTTKDSIKWQLYNVKFSMEWHKERAHYLVEWYTIFLFTSIIWNGFPNVPYIIQGLQQSISIIMPLFHCNKSKKRLLNGNVQCIGCDQFLFNFLLVFNHLCPVVAWKCLQQIFVEIVKIIEGKRK